MASVQCAQDSFFLLLNRQIGFLVFCHKLQRQKAACGSHGHVCIQAGTVLCSVLMQACLGNLLHMRGEDLYGDV